MRLKSQGLKEECAQRERVRVCVCPYDGLIRNTGRAGTHSRPPSLRACAISPYKTGAVVYYRNSPDGALDERFYRTFPPPVQCPVPVSRKEIKAEVKTSFAGSHFSEIHVSDLTTVARVRLLASNQGAN